MLHALTSDRIRAAEEKAVAQGSGATLAGFMRRAGAAVAAIVAARVPEGHVVVLAGRGNNGGDGWVVAGELVAEGRDVRVLTVVEPSDLIGPAAEAASAAIAAGVTWEAPADAARVSEVLEGSSACVDALLGIGASGPLRDPLPAWIEAANGGDVFRVAVDVPSGIDADTGAVEGTAFAADVTVTFSTAKPGLMLFPGARYVGELAVVDVGIPRELLEEPGALELWSDAEYARLLPLPDIEAHKNSRGRLLIVAGSGAFPGAAALAVMGAQRMGAGYVTVAVPESVAPILQRRFASAVIVGLPENPSRTFASKATDAIVNLSREADAVVLGPGVTLSHGVVLLVRAAVKRIESPLVIDADGLNALVDVVDVLTAREATTVITPHAGELARLLAVSAEEIQADRLSFGSRLAGPSRTCVLKGPHTVISGAGRQIINVSGGPWLATAGTGDVLAGMVGALVAQGLGPLEASALAAHLHGRAGDLAADALTPVCVTAEDVPAHVPGAVRELLEGS
ncbi:MAG: NAD(P)H-hydrate dehydratase [Actinomycetota bacterium]|nr:NAD(P)H-hydrate dehydratase [Actinomycetota bacterium]